MRTLKQIAAGIMREIYYQRSEGLVDQLCVIDDLLTRSYAPKLNNHLEERRYLIGAKLERADQKFWYYAARDGKH